MTRPPWLIPLFVAVLPAVAGEARGPELTPEQKAIKELFAQLEEAFTSGNHRLLEALVIARDEAEERRRADIVRSARTEFRRHAYRNFDVLRFRIDERLGAKRVDVWVNLRTECVDSADGVVHEEFHNDTFLLERRPNGSFQIVDSPYFLTLGRQQGVGLIADALLVLIGCLVGLVFWVWMGFAAFSLRPRRPAWRVLVLLLPLLGALVFFVACYLPGLFRRSPAVVEAGT